MANSKKQKQLTISKLKSEKIYTWFNEKGVGSKKYRDIISEKLNKSRVTLFRDRDKLIKIAEEENEFAALSKVFTIYELNVIIEVFNDYQDAPPEEKESKEEKHQRKLESQKEKVNKSLNDMGMKPLKEDEYRINNSDSE
ncbi:hypothetical protein [Mammaliicoccus sciuri]|uniref:hypothetical protein n=1 Tax=Mammaliicoccus sciuri TaxID=1296 RepID=UPI003F571AC9